MNVIIQRRRARDRCKLEERVFRPAFMAIKAAFGSGEPLGEFLYAHLVEPSFGRGVTLGNRWKADTEAFCFECRTAFATYHFVCPGCGETRRLSYRKGR